MASLYKSLRSLLPLEYVKGKRSVSDHVNETVKYIGHLQKRAEELKKRRNELKRLMLSNSSKTAYECTRICDQTAIVSVKPCIAGVEVILNTASGEGGIPLSRLLQLLIDEGLSISNCSSSKVDGRLLHTIESSKVDEVRSTVLTELQKKLVEKLGVRCII